MNKNSPKKTYIIFFFKLNILLFFVLININFIKKNKTMTSICLIVKQENRYIKEFINYYRKLKINKIFIYDNNDLN